MASNAEMIEEALTESTLGPASDRDAAQYWANLARKLARALQAATATPSSMTAKDRAAAESTECGYIVTPGHRYCRECGGGGLVDGEECRVCLGLGECPEKKEN